MKRSMIMILMLVELVVTGCLPVGPDAVDSSKKPADFSFDFHWNVGSLPPPYHYSYDILVTEGGNGQFIYQEGYEGEDAQEPVMREFTLSQEQLKQLYDLMIEKDMLREKWEEGEILLGAPSAAMTITANGKKYEILDDASMITVDRKAVNEVYDFLRSLLPQSIWNELALWREQANSSIVSPSG